MIPNHYKLFYLLLSTFVLSVADGVLTVVNIHSGCAYEANPLMAYLLNISTTVFIVFKILISVLSVTVLWCCRSYKLASKSAMLCFFIYLAVVIWNVAILLVCLS